MFGNNRGVAKISNNLNGLSKTCGGFIFKFKVQENQLIPKYRISGKKWIKKQNKKYCSSSL